MARPAAPALHRRFRRLDETALARFVAGLWAGAGWSTAVRDDHVVARRRSPRSERLTIAIIADTGALAEALVHPPGDADLLVAPVGDRATRLLATRTGLRVVDAEGLRERLTYGVDEEVRECLLARLDARATRPPGRRTVLSALAVAVVGVASGATAPGLERNHGPISATGTELGGPARAGPVVVAPDRSKASPDPRGATDGSPTRPTSQPHSESPSCDVGPRQVVHRQVTLVHREFRASRSSDVDPGGLLDDGHPDLTEGFVRAIEAAGVAPLRRARSVNTGAVERDGGRARVRVRAATGSGQRVVYVFALARADDGCWLVTGAWLYAGPGST